ncbi:hypothetical protein GTP38_08765 [Duganella sp. FT94W]|uniref:Uncharacterized protein n=1 Tax=Duganella lactea TaxID=2692173 RepID=A0ABW9V9X3_9BURK|nr:hypothetical protein [Duganella lactea]MYM34427.1 hypothetical protein [Duganella lactea]
MLSVPAGPGPRRDAINSEHAYAREITRITAQGGTDEHAAFFVYIDLEREKAATICQMRRAVGAPVRIADQEVCVGQHRIQQRKAAPCLVARHGGWSVGDHGFQGQGQRGGMNRKAWGRAVASTVNPNAGSLAQRDTACARQSRIQLWLNEKTARENFSKSIISEFSMLMRIYWDNAVLEVF